jgi:hypothetical protein
MIAIILWDLTSYFLSLINNTGFSDIHEANLKKNYCTELHCYIYKSAYNIS